MVLGWVAAERLAIADVDIARRVYIGGDWFVVIGILDDMPLHPDIERAVMIGEPVARELFENDLQPTALYARIHPDFVDDVVDVIPATVNPQNPDQISVTRPADALVARQAAEEALTGLLVGLGSVALLVGGVAIANIMVMSVLERRMEVGVRRALGATKRHIRLQFLGESVLLAGIGGVLGVLIGASITVAYAINRDLTLSVPLYGLFRVDRDCSGDRSRGRSLPGVSCGQDPSGGGSQVELTISTARRLSTTPRFRQAWRRSEGSRRPIPCAATPR